MLDRQLSECQVFSDARGSLPQRPLATGTPPGVGFGKNRFMAVGDVLECGIEHLGAQRHEIQA
jgi:2,4-diketo-3-deoxy-L-fuconate hydrolase